MIYTNQDRPDALARHLARKERRGQVVGFVGPDNRTHAIARSEDGGRLHVFRCDESSRRVGETCAFIANPKHPLCLACVAAIEDEIRGEKA